MSEACGVHSARKELLEFDVVALGIFHLKAEISVAERLECRWDGHALRSEVGTQLPRVGSFEGEVGAAIFSGILEFGPDLNVLVVIHLE